MSPRLIPPRILLIPPLSDPELGALQAFSLREHLEQVLKPFPVTLRTGKGFVSVVPQGVDKGVAVSYVLESLATERSLSLGMSAGNTLGTYRLNIYIIFSVAKYLH
jgi:hypothetical protein